MTATPKNRRIGPTLRHAMMGLPGIGACPRTRIGFFGPSHGPVRAIADCGCREERHGPMTLPRVASPDGFMSRSSETTGDACATAELPLHGSRPSRAASALDPVTVLGVSSELRAVLD